MDGPSECSILSFPLIIRHICCGSHGFNFLTLAISDSTDSLFFLNWLLLQKEQYQLNTLLLTTDGKILHHLKLQNK